MAGQARFSFFCLFRAGSVGSVGSVETGGLRTRDETWLFASGDSGRHPPFPWELPPYGNESERSRRSRDWPGQPPGKTLVRRRSKRRHPEGPHCSPLLPRHCVLQTSLRPQEQVAVARGKDSIRRSGHFRISTLQIRQPVAGFRR